MPGLTYGLGAMVALAIAAPAFAGDLTSIELDPSGKIAVAVKKDSAKLAAIPDIGGIPNKGFTYGAVHQVAPNSIDISKGINVMRGHVDAKGSIAVHEGPNQVYVLYVISGTGKMTLNDKDGKQYGDITYKPDDVILFQPHTWHAQRLDAARPERLPSAVASWRNCTGASAHRTNLGPHMMMAMPRRLTATPTASVTLGRTPSTSHSHKMAMPM